MDRIDDISNEITKFFVRLKDEILCRTILDDYQTNEDKNIKFFLKKGI
jgi:hypothetical protein